MLDHRTKTEGELTFGLAEAVRRDGSGNFRDEALFELLESIRGADERADRLKSAAILIGFARRIEHSAEDYPALVREAAKLTERRRGTERERALHAVRTVIRPVSERCMRD